MRRMIAAVLLVVACLCVPPVRAQQVVFSNTGTNFIATVYPPGYTNNAAYEVIGTNLLGALAFKIDVTNIGTGTVLFVQGSNTTTSAIVQTNPVAGVRILTNDLTKTLTSWPVVDQKPWSAYTDTTGIYGKVWISISKP